MKRRIVACLLAFITILLLPVILTLSLGLGMALNESFHISVIKNLNIVETIIRLRTTRWKMKSNMKSKRRPA